jgi:hypothetical protein
MHASSALHCASAHICTTQWRSPDRALKRKSARPADSPARTKQLFNARDAHASTAEGLTLLALVSTPAKAAPRGDDRVGAALLLEKVKPLVGFLLSQTSVNYPPLGLAWQSHKPRTTRLYCF